MRVRVYADGPTKVLHLTEVIGSVEEQEIQFSVKSPANSITPEYQIVILTEKSLPGFGISVIDEVPQVNSSPPKKKFVDVFQENLHPSFFFYSPTITSFFFFEMKKRKKNYCKAVLYSL